MAERLFSTYQVAELLGATPGTIVEWMQKGWLPYKRLPDGPIRISEKGLVQFLKGRGIDLSDVLAKATAREKQRQQSLRAEAAITGLDEEIAASERQALLTAPTQAVGGNGGNAKTAKTFSAAADEAFEEAPSQPGVNDETQIEAIADSVLNDDSIEVMLRGVDAGDTNLPAAALNEKPAADKPPSRPAAARHTPASAAKPAAPAPVATRQEAPPAPAPRVPQPSPEPAKPAEVSPPRSASPPPPKQAADEPEPFTEAPADQPGQLAEQIIRCAVRRGASAVHITSAGMASLRLRIGQSLQGVPELAAAVRTQGRALVEHLRREAGLGASPGKPERASLQQVVEGRQLALELVATPLADGELVVVSIRDDAARAMELTQLGVVPADAQRLGRLLARQGGLFIVVAPTRKARMAVVRAMAAPVADDSLSVIAVDGGREALLGGAARIVAGRAGVPFADAVASAAGLDTDVLAVAELRDPGTIVAAVDAADDDVKVIAGSAAASAADAISELLQLGAEPWPLSRTLRAVVECRFVRKLCQSCRGSHDAPADRLAALGISSRDLSKAWSSSGCDKCAQTGYSGGAGLFSVMYVEGSVAEAIRGGKGASDIAAATGGESLRGVALRAARDGVVSLDELLRAGL